MKRPGERPPRADEECPLCKAPPNIPHAANCPWRVWADDPQVRAES